MKFQSYFCKIAISRYYSTVFILLPFCLFFACSSSRTVKSSKRPLYQQIYEDSKIINQSLSGFILFDPANKKILYQHQADKYFTPASNTKLLTLYTCLQILDQSTPGIRYVEKGDSLIFWGTGDPSFLNPFFESDSTIFSFLKNHPKKLFYCPANFQDQHYGPGWAWDDYNYAFQAEKSAFPIYSNLVHFYKAEKDSQFQVSPAFFQTHLLADSSFQKKYLQRHPEKNQFRYNPKYLTDYTYDQEHPIKYSDSLLIELLQDTLKRPVALYPFAQLPPKDTKTLVSAPLDSLYRLLMQDSDNFIAEQLLLLCSNALFDTLNSERVMEYAQEELFRDFPDAPIWDDGSGLSRYNLLTPRTLIHILHQLYLQQSPERLLHIFPAGGESGTIASWYANKPPFVFAKTGTLRNNHCLSGLVRTSHGKMFLFSFMHNHFPGSSAPYKEEMEKILRAIYVNY